jgi:hypothetical protein
VKEKVVFLGSNEAEQPTRSPINQPERTKNNNRHLLTNNFQVPVKNSFKKLSSIS